MSGRGTYRQGFDVGYDLATEHAEREWRGKVEALEAEIATLRDAHAERIEVLRAELAASDMKDVHHG